MYEGVGRRRDLLGHQRVLPPLHSSLKLDGESDMWTLKAFSRIPWTTLIPFCPSVALSHVIVFLLSTFPQGSISWHSSRMFPNVLWVSSHQCSDAPAAHRSILGGPWSVNNPCCQSLGGHPAGFLRGRMMNIKICYNYEEQNKTTTKPKTAQFPNLQCL